MKPDYHSFVGREFVIVRPLYEDIVNEREFCVGYVPKWNYVGNVLTITACQQWEKDQDCTLNFKDHNGNASEVLLEYDFDNGFLIPLEEYVEDEVDGSFVLNLI